MLAENHTKVAIGSGVLILGASSYLSTVPYAEYVMKPVYETLNPMQEDIVATGITIALSVVSLLFGSWLPDVDNPTSRLGRFIPIIPGPHRGFTHTDFFILLCGAGVAVASHYYPVAFLWWAVIGMWSHIFIDGFSTAGRVRFYPIPGDWKITRFRDGVRCVVRKKSRVALYGSGLGRNEEILAWFVLGLGVIFGVAGLML